jgi:glycosyltransferase involved in cell wall biosynthesis
MSMSSYQNNVPIPDHNNNNNKNSKPNVVVIFAAKNEENTIQNPIATAKRSYYEPTVIVVDAYSTDKTTELVRNSGVVIIQQSKQMFPGKGLAMKEGLKEAITKSASTDDHGS